jgi:hypothetical protein
MDRHLLDIDSSKIPTVSEAQTCAMKPNYFLVIPWRFRAGVLRCAQEFLRGGLARGFD